MTTFLIGILAPLSSFNAFIPEDYSPIPLEQRHLTLVYLGELRDVHSVCEKLSGFQARPFKLVFKGLEALPSLYKPRYLAATPTPEGTVKLSSLRGALTHLLEAPADRYGSFRPHVSIAHTRLKPNLDLVERVRRAVRDGASVTEEVEVAALHLLRAEGGRVAPVYTARLQGR